YREKKARNNALREFKLALTIELAEQFPDADEFIGSIVEELKRDYMRKLIVEKGIRFDGRKPDEIRPIKCDVGILPRTHGSSIFTRGETQAFCVLTLGTKLDEQKIEDIEGESFKSFLLHYNFPPFSVGEVKPIRGPGRREIGHGALAERSLLPIIPSEDIFPYTIRIVSDILESNGSSSMASVCAASLALMDAGVPVKEHIAGVAMGLVKENDKSVVLTDIIGDEDHHGDMDFKLAGTRNGLTGFQLDVKLPGLSFDIISQALSKAKDARANILDIMYSTIDKPRPTLSKYAPRIATLQIPTDKIGELIGTGGKIIRNIQEETGSTISIEPDGKVHISSMSQDGIEKAIEQIKLIIAEPEVGAVYEGVVKRIVPFGAFIEILPHCDGLLHISEIDHRRLTRVEDVLKEGERVMVKVIGIDEQGKIRLSRKALIKKEEPQIKPKEKDRERRGQRYKL
ncbi:MAG: polyribonucleotide nucleotidyltransferase, partial [bacterium]